MKVEKVSKPLSSQTSTTASNLHSKNSGIRTLQSSNPLTQRDAKLQGIQELANHSHSESNLLQFKVVAGKSQREKKMQILQMKAGDAANRKSMNSDSVNQSRKNETGMPDRLLAGVETLSGYDMSDVRVHYNSDKPAQLQAHAYAQGNQIYLGAGQERHLPHEVWHVVQQKQGRVRATMQLKGMGVNDDVGLEREADLMGRKALQGYSIRGRSAVSDPRNVTQVVSRPHSSYLKRKSVQMMPGLGKRNPKSMGSMNPSNSNIKRIKGTSRPLGPGGNRPPGIPPPPPPPKANINYPKVNRVEFTQSHQMTQYGPDNRNNPVWTPGAVDHAAAYTHNTSQAVNAQIGFGQGSRVYGTQRATLRVMEGNVELGRQNVGINDAGINVNGIVLAGLLGSDAVRATTKHLLWQVTVHQQNWTNLGITGAHQLYWLADAPRTQGNPSNFAVARATQFVNGGQNVAVALRGGIRGILPYDGAMPISVDPLALLVNPRAAICTDFGNLMVLLSQSIGLPANTYIFWGGFRARGINFWVTNALSNWGPTIEHVNPGNHTFTYHVIARVNGSLEDAALNRTGIDASAFHQGRQLNLLEPTPIHYGPLYTNRNYQLPLPFSSNIHTVAVEGRDYGNMITGAQIANHRTLPLQQGAGVYTVPLLGVTQPNPSLPGMNYAPYTRELVGRPNLPQQQPHAFILQTVPFNSFGFPGNAMYLITVRLPPPVARPVHTGAGRNLGGPGRGNPATRRNLRGGGP